MFLFIYDVYSLKYLSLYIQHIFIKHTTSTVFSFHES